MFLLITIILLSESLYASEQVPTEENNELITDQTIYGNNLSNEITDNKNHITYNDKSVVPENTSEKNYYKTNTQTVKEKNITLKDYPKNPDISMPFYMDDNSIAICIEPYEHLTTYESTYNTDPKNRTIINMRNGENVTDYIKIYLYNHMKNPEETFCRNDSDNTVESALKWGVWYFILYDYKIDRYPPEMESFMKSAKEETLNFYKENGSVADEGILTDGITHYKIEFLLNTNEDVHYQNLISFKTWIEDNCNMSWAWKLVNESKINVVNETYYVDITENVTNTSIEYYTENVTEYINKTYVNNITSYITEEVPYNTTESYLENITVYIPKTVTEEYTVNVTNTIPYTVEEEYKVNSTILVPLNKSVEYIVNITREIPQNITESFMENVTIYIPVNKTINYTVYVTKKVPYNTTENYLENITEMIPFNKTENYTVNVTKTVPCDVSEYYKNNISFRQNNSKINKFKNSPVITNKTKILEKEYKIIGQNTNILGNSAKKQEKNYKMIFENIETLNDKKKDTRK